MSAPSLDECVAAFAAAAAHERRAVWLAGDVLVQAVAHIRVRTPGDERARARAALFRSIASAAHCSTGRVRQVWQVAAAFPDGVRYPDTPWSLYRAALSAAGRLGRDPIDVLTEAVREGRSVAAVSALGRAGLARRGCRGRCPTCEADITVRYEGRAAENPELQDVAVPCGVCVALSWRRSADARSVDRVGVLA